MLDETTTGTIYGEYLFNRIVIDAWQSGALGALDMDRTDFAEMMERRGWTYDETGHHWRKHRPASSPLLAGL